MTSHNDPLTPVERELCEQVASWAPGLSKSSGVLVASAISVQVDLLAIIGRLVAELEKRP